MRWEKAGDIEKRIKELITQLSFPHIKPDGITCFRSFGSKSAARARTWGYPRIWQQALTHQPHYIIEVLAEKFDRLSIDDQTRVLIHELLHIPKTFSGALVAHRGRTHRIDSRIVEQLFQEFREVKQRRAK